MRAVGRFRRGNADEHEKDSSPLIPRALRPVALVFALALVAAGPAHAELVASGVTDGMLAVDSKGTPRVAYVQGTRLVITTRSANGWRPANVGAVTAGSR